MKPFRDTSAIILSAGNSERMGKHKALLEFDANTTFIQKITKTFSLAGVDQVIVVVNAELYKLIKEREHALLEEVILVINDKPELGRFYSLQTGNKHVKPGNYCFIQNIDNPFTTEKLLNELILYKYDADVIMPSYKDKAGHPILISPLVVQEILDVRDPFLRIDMFLKGLEVKKIETSDSNILANINSPEDYLQTRYSF